MSLKLLIVPLEVLMIIKSTIPIGYIDKVKRRLKMKTSFLYNFA